eukprot:TRINITY_DN51903_c0_g1_i1.p1 TRINITY_DN51903_c0_g1~~TRINITY_DN51903_c0_g1_i1.p1  ORF type:complete len:113 (+),score=22.39 TRINITY_DN51903_c0_g1_i1:73-411(+)
MQSKDRAWMLPAAAAMAPFSLFLVAHQRGLTVKLFDAAYRSFGIPGLLGVPFFTLSLEKSVYDTVNCYQGKDPNEAPEGSTGGFPSGGCALPSFSLIPINKEGCFYEPPAGA